MAVAVVSGRTRTLVERFERRERFNSNDDQATGIFSPVIPEDQVTGVFSPVIPEDQATSTFRTVVPEDQATSISSPVMSEDQATSISGPVIHEMDKTFTMQVSSIPKQCFLQLSMVVHLGHLKFHFPIHIEEALQFKIQAENEHFLRL